MGGKCCEWTVARDSSGNSLLAALPIHSKRKQTGERTNERERERKSESER